MTDLIPIRRELLERVTKTCMFTMPADDYTELRTALAAPVQSAVPDDYLIVPIQPTEEMRKRAQDYLAAEGMIVSDWLVHTVYTEMLAAAPSAPATVQGDGWIPVSERLPDVEQRLDKPCELEGKPLPPLNITSTVQCFDGTRVFADAIEWFDGGQPMKGVTHWKPLDEAPAAIAAARKGEQ